MNILWDLDGTIFNTYPTIMKSLQQAAGKELDELQLLSLLKENSAAAFEYFGLDDSIRENCKTIERGIHPNEKEPFEYVRDVLENNEVNVIVTHKDKKSVSDLLAHWNMSHLFSEVLCLEDDDFPRKPESDSYEYLHKKYNIDLVIGDRSLDLKPARKLGIPTCSFQNENIEADFYINSYKEFQIITQTLKNK
ncbi:HAD hydrolase-like protein [Bacillus cereus]|uniref:HAD hydrolase-like protein n=1 Tax=Bacillus cereus TaxID=1396 RepID=UPI0015962299|nr:HAD hydrolase-like protein [Bacillus cereus]